MEMTYKACYYCQPGRSSGRATTKQQKVLQNSKCTHGPVQNHGASGWGPTVQPQTRTHWLAKVSSVSKENHVRRKASGCGLWATGS